MYHVCKQCGETFWAEVRKRTFCSIACVSAHAEAHAAERFWSHVDRSGGPDACWPWLASCFWHGYGKFAKNQRLHYAHRFAYELANGPIPDGMFVCHTCDNRKCVNPAHLFLGTHTDNMRDAARKKRLPGPTRLTWPKVRAIRDAYATGQSTQETLAQQYGVGPSTIRRIVQRRIWQE